MNVGILFTSQFSGTFFGRKYFLHGKDVHDDNFYCASSFIVEIHDA